MPPHETDKELRTLSLFTRAVVDRSACCPSCLECMYVMAPFRSTPCVSAVDRRIPHRRLRGRHGVSDFTSQRTPIYPLFDTVREHRPPPQPQPPRTTLPSRHQQPPLSGKGSCVVPFGVGLPLWGNPRYYLESEVISGSALRSCPESRLEKLPQEVP